MKANALPLLLTMLLTVQGQAFAAPDEADADSAEAAAATSALPDMCNQVAEPDKFPERFRSGVHELACRSFRWFDGLFGDEHDFLEEAVGGKMSIGLSWNEFEGTGGRLRYRVRTDLPNFSSRWDAFFGRVDEDAFVSDTESVEESEFRRGLTSRDEPEWLLGLGYKDRSESGDGWDYSIGIRLRTPPRVFAKATFQKHFNFRPNLELNYRQTVFWRDGVGYGTTTYLDTSHELTHTNLSRYEFVGTLSEETDGTRWYAGHTWYRQLAHHKGLSLKTFVRGETSHVVPLQEYGFELTYRRQVARDWLFLNIGPTLTWPRELLEQKREASLGFSTQIEFEFGHQRGY